MQKSKLVFHCDSPGYGGSEIDLQRVASMIRPAGQIITFICADADKRLYQYCQESKLEFHFLPSRSGHVRNLGFGFRRALRMWERIPTGAIHIIWAHHLDSNRWLQVFLCLVGAPFIVCERLVPSSPDDLQTSKLTAPLLKLVARSAHCFTVCGHAQIQNLPRVVGGYVARLCAVPNSRPVHNLNAESKALRVDTIGLRRRLNISADAYVALSVARICAAKNQELVIRALPALLKAIPNLIFIIVGEGDDRDFLEKLAAELSVSPHVCFAGRQADPLAYYAAADVFLLPSLTEGLSGALIEAIACGLPCVVSDIEANRELVRGGDGSFLFSLDSAVSFQNAVIEAHNSRAKNTALLERAYNHLLARYDEGVETAMWRGLFARLDAQLNPQVI